MNQNRFKRTNMRYKNLNYYDSKQDLMEANKVDIRINETEDSNGKYKIVGIPSVSSPTDNRLLAQLNTKFNEKVKFNHNYLLND